MSAPHLDALVEALRTDFAAEARGAGIADRLGRYAREHVDWRPWALFDEVSYTRNLVARDERFELMILCWGPGQVSPIHNHEGQDCWMAVLEGDIEEVRYPTPTQDAAGPLEPSGSQVFGRGQVAFIRDDIGLHLVRSAASDRGGVSLHLYAAPYDACNVYCPDTGRVTRRALVNHSVRGRVLAGA